MLIFEDSGGFFFLFPCRILVTQPDIEPVSPALGTQAHNHWTAREVSTGGNLLVLGVILSIMSSSVIK